MVSVLAFYSDDPSSNPADAYSFSVQILFEKNENKQKEAGVGPFLKRNLFMTSAPVSASFSYVKCSISSLSTYICCILKLKIQTNLSCATAKNEMTKL